MTLTEQAKQELCEQMAKMAFKQTPHEAIAVLISTLMAAIVMQSGNLKESLELLEACNERLKLMIKTYDPIIRQAIAEHEAEAEEEEAEHG
jgi:predicted Zn-dependent protease